MPVPVLIDTDMGADDAIAIALALLSPELEVRGLVSVGGNVNIDQATRNVGRLLAALRPGTWPMVGRGLDQDRPGLTDASHVFGADGLGGADLPDATSVEVRDFRDVYGEFLASPGELQIVAIGPLTNLAAVLNEDRSAFSRLKHLYVMGGALWCKGNVQGVAEFNFHRDPPAAAAVLASGLPISLVTLDVTRFVTLDESNLAHLAASDSSAGDALGRIMAFPLQHSTEAGPGRFIIHDALAVGAILWPELFVRTRMAVEVTTSGDRAGHSKPVLRHPTLPSVDVLTAVNAVDFIENLLERLCQEKDFVV
jgi:inosine-uridine nucleoside N-ribohydrolase